MKHYNRHGKYYKLWILSGLFFLVSCILQYLMGNYLLAALQAVVAILALLDAYIYRQPYLGLSEDKLIINKGLIKKVILLKDITSLVQSEKQLKLAYNEGTTTKQQKIALAMLKDIDKEEFLEDFKPLLTI